MAATKDIRVVVLLSTIIYPVIFSQEYQIPDVTIQALKPKGIRVSIPDNPVISLFAFNGNINNPIEDADVGTISAEVENPKNGLWVFQDDDVELRAGDVIYYYVHINRNRKSYHKTGLSYSIKELVDPNKPLVPSTSYLSSDTQPSCQLSVTEVREGPVCSKELIFEDNFDTLRKDLWTIEQYIPEGPEYPFVSYQVPTVSVKNGLLRIYPYLQQELPGFNVETLTRNNHTLDLSYGCTRPNMCRFTNRAFNIMPPIASGRITSQNFAFKYGLIEIRAKLPQGDWLYPDIILESFSKEYGADNYASGILRIAGARGNIELAGGYEDYGNKVLYGGPIMNYECRRRLLSIKKSQVAWGDEFHVFSLRWAPDTITLLVDGEEWGRIAPQSSGLQGYLPTDLCGPRNVLYKTPMAPFDTFITLGLAAGGISEFPDASFTKNSKPKPWINKSPKAKIRFIKDANFWRPTWSQPGLLVDYVRVYAL